jgi:hypothetical protein
MKGEVVSSMKGVVSVTTSAGVVVVVVVLVDVVDVVVVPLNLFKN